MGKVVSPCQPRPSGPCRLNAGTAAHLLLLLFRLKSYIHHIIAHAQNPVPANKFDKYKDLKGTNNVNFTFLGYTELYGK